MDWGATVRGVLVAKEPFDAGESLWRRVGRSLLPKKREVPGEARLIEGAWCRTHREWKLMCLSLPFLVLDGLVAIFAGGGPKLTALIVFFGLFCAAVVPAFVYALFQQRNEARDALVELRSQREQIQEFKAECVAWCAEVETFLDAREVTRPKSPHGGGGIRQQLAAKLAGTHVQRSPEEVAAEKEAERRQGEYDAETAGSYIERYRPDGLQRFEVLVALGVLVDTNRELLRNPKTQYDVWKAVDTVRTGAERLGY